MRGAEAVVRMWQSLGVDFVFGLCGDTTLPLYEALHDIDHRIRHVLTRDERSASYMADAYARLSGRVGVCEGPSGGGATTVFTFVLMPPPVALEQLEGALQQQVGILKKELQTLKSILESR